MVTEIMVAVTAALKKHGIHLRSEVYRDVRSAIAGAVADYFTGGVK